MLSKFAVACVEDKELHTAKGAEAAIHRYDDAIDKAGAGAAEPDQGADQLLGFTKATGGCMIDDRLSACGERAVIIEQQRTVLVAHKEAGRNGVDALAGATGTGQFYCQPARGVINYSW